MIKDEYGKITDSALCFDLWKTLIKSHEKYKLARAKCVFEFLDRKKPGFTSFGRVYDSIKAQEYELDLLAEHTHEQVGYNTAWNMVLHEALFNDGYFNMEEMWELTEELRKVLKKYPPQLMEGVGELIEKTKDYPRVLISNTMLIRGSELTEVVDLSMFDYLIFSDEIGIAKPHPGMFVQAQVYLENVFGIPMPENILHIGDNPRTDGACTVVGMEYFQLDHKTKSVKDLLEYLKIN